MCISLGMGHLGNCALIQAPMWPIASSTRSGDGAASTSWALLCLASEPIDRSTRWLDRIGDSAPSPIVDRLSAAAAVMSGQVHARTGHHPGE